MLNENRIITILCIALSLALTGCGNGGDNNGATPGGGEAARSRSADGGHDHGGESQADHDHASGDHDDHDDHGHDHGGAQRSVGALAIGETVLDVTIEGEIAPNAEVHVEIVHQSGPAPAAVRLWIGEESGIGSLKAKADSHDGHFHAHAETPAAIHDSTALWVEIETANGERIAKSMPMK